RDQSRALQPGPPAAAARRPRRRPPASARSAAPVAAGPRGPRPARATRSRRRARRQPRALTRRSSDDSEPFPHGRVHAFRPGRVDSRGRGITFSVPSAPRVTVSTTDPAAPLLSVCIPAHNEQENIGRTIDAIATSLTAAAIPYEFVIANDNSTDGTGRVIEER